MNILGIQNRLRQLNAQKYLSDDEVGEKEQLLDELALLRSSNRIPSKPQLIKIPHANREHSAVGKAMISGVKGIIEHFKEKPATLEEIQQLKLEAMKHRLKADIAKSKRVQRGTNVSSPKRKSSLSKNADGPTEDISKLLRGAVHTKGADFFSSGGSSKNIRKAFYG